MEVDEPASDNIPMWPIPNIPKNARERAYKHLGLVSLPSSDPDHVSDSLFLICCIVHDALSCDPELEGFLANEGQFLANVESQGNEEFINFLKDMKERNIWQELPYNDVFFIIPQPPTFSKASIKAVEQAWERNFEGDAADVLISTISTYLDKEKDVYARQTSIVNSSGTGKSRMVDKAAMEIITVPICLCEVKSQVFPPPDTVLVKWFSPIRSSGDQATVAKRLHGFLFVLLSVLWDRLRNIETRIPELHDSELIDASKLAPSTLNLDTGVIGRQQQLALAFRCFMTDGQVVEGPNEYRTQFYEAVTQMADSFTSHIKEEHRPDGSSRFVSEAFYNEGVKQAGIRLWDLIDPHRVLDSAAGARWPLVILAFDESHTLADNPQHQCWTTFSELRHTLRELVDCPFFSLFLLMAGKFHIFSPETRFDPSSRIVDLSLHTLDPITEISFDALAPLPKQHTLTLADVTNMKWISHLGRPCFGAAYDASESGSQEELVLFAQQKLLGDTTHGDEEGILACLSVRFALEFNEDPISRSVALTQVERHMRLCVAATTGFEKLVTLAGSEPLLAEAAFKFIRQLKQSPARCLVNHSDLYCVDRGQHGELVAAMIIMQARDTAQLESGTKERWVSVMDFMKALLPESDYNKLREIVPRFGVAGSFATTFKKYRLWFNHVIKIEEASLINTQYLWRFITRGAMVICKDNQQGVDIVLPACTKKELSPDTVTAILIQVKNDLHYGCSINKVLFDGMDPFAIGLFSEGQSPRPVIRLVFALASKESGVLFRQPGQKRSDRHPDGFTSFDIWCAGLGAFKGIDNDLDAYQSLLHRSTLPYDVLDLGKTEDSESNEARRGYLRHQMAALTTTKAIRGSN